LAHFDDNTNAISPAQFIDAWHSFFKPRSNSNTNTTENVEVLARTLVRDQGRINLTHLRTVSKGNMRALLSRSDLAPSISNTQKTPSPKHSVIHPLQTSALRSAAVHTETKFSGAPWHSIVISHSASRRVPCIFSVEERRNSVLDESSSIMIQTIVRGFLARRCLGAKVGP
jgi:hypothetical protein